MALTRRDFLGRVAAAGGAPLVYEAMSGLGLLAPSAPVRFEPAGQVAGVRVVVLGAGCAGLAAAYELGKLGYECQVLEARSRPGGRAFTVRRGTTSEEDGPSHTAAFGEGLYFNAGPMRISHHHELTLGYCRELKVPIEMFGVTCDSTYLYQQDAAGLRGQRIRLREARTDYDGYVAELLSKAVSESALDRALTKDDRERLLEYLRRAGALNGEGMYRGSPRSGRSTPVPLSDLLKSDVGEYLQLDYDYQPTMFQVAGGNDRLAEALAARVKDRITYRAAVREIRQTERGVSVVYADRDGRVRTVTGDYCICAMPLTIVAGLQTDFSRETQASIAAVRYATAGKMGLQFKRRFWEEDDNIYGGASKTDQPIGEIYYPSTGFHGQKGVLLGYYVRGQNSLTFGDLSPAERIATALEQGSRIHPQYHKEFEAGFSVAWHRMPWIKGSWSAFGGNTREQLRRGDGRVYFAGDHMSTMNAWMQGAFQSARDVVMTIHARAVPEGRSA